MRDLLPRSPVKRLLVLAGAAALSCVIALNLAVAFFGETLVNPLSPFFLKARALALGRYALHRPLCALRGGHDDLSPVVVAAAQRHGLDRWLLAALVQVESGTKAHRISPNGAMGPAQLISSTAELLGVDDPFDPAEGIDGGARYLREMLGRFRGNTALAVAAYNAGPAAIVGGRVPRNGETEYYVERVLARWRATRPPPPPPPKPAPPPPPKSPAKPPKKPPLKGGPAPDRPRGWRR